MLQTQITNSPFIINFKIDGNNRKSIKKYTFWLFFLSSLFSSQFLFSQCPPGDVTLETQDQIDNFVATYPACTKVSGNLNLIGKEITDLFFMNDITQIDGDLNIELTSITSVPLNCLKSLVADLIIYGNEYLQALKRKSG